MKMDYKYLKDNNLIIFECIVGSTAYGTNLPHSDQDKKYVYILPFDMLMRDDYVEQVNDEKNDHVGYEIGRFIDLLNSNNPNLFDLLYAPEDCILYQHPIWDMILKNRDSILSKKCRASFGFYASSQVKKARGLNKKMVNPVDKERKTPLDFCFVLDPNNGKSYELQSWMDKNSYQQKFFGAINVPHADGIYSLFYDWNAHILFCENGDKANQEKLKAAKKLAGEPLGFGYKGIINGEDLKSNALRLSSIPKGEQSVALIYYNQNGYSMYCKSYHEYWDWVEKRSPERYATNMKHDKGYDSKNLSHCIRLLQMCLEIGQDKKVEVRRSNREELLSIRAGDVEYDDIIKMTEDLILKINNVYDNSDLPEIPDQQMLKDLLMTIRKEYYKL